MDTISIIVRKRVITDLKPSLLPAIIHSEGPIRPLKRFPWATLSLCRQAVSPYHLESVLTICCSQLVLRVVKWYHNNPILTPLVVTFSGFWDDCYLILSYCFKMFMQHLTARNVYNRYLDRGRCDFLSDPSVHPLFSTSNEDYRFVKITVLNHRWEFTKKLIILDNYFWIFISARSIFFK